jgi:hypothetical protein
VILLAAPIALVMNFVRSLTLTLLANSGVHIEGRWHDVTGFAVLGVTAVLLAGLALLLERKPRRPTASEDVSAQPPADSAPVSTADTYPPYLPRSSPHARRLLVAGLLAAVGLAAFFFVKTRPAVQHSAPAPDLAAFLPESVPGWRVDTSRELYQFASTLRTEHLAQRTYSRETDDGPEIVTLYLAYWKPGQASVSLVASHTPDACWPGAGWQAVPVSAPRARVSVASRVLAEAEVRSFKSGEYPQNVWYWHLYDGQPLTQENPNSPVELLRLAVRYGFRRDGDQLFVRISSNREWPTIQNAPFIETLFSHLQSLGL